MSTRLPRSRSMDRGCLAQDVMSAIEVAALLHDSAVEDVHLATDELSQLLLEPEPFEAGRAFTRLEAHQEVDVALAAEVLAQDRAEDFEPGDAPLPAEGGQGLGRDLQPLADHRLWT